MSSVKQIIANRANAQLSTGPNTASGKRKSSMNAVKHGLSAQTIVVGDEDPAEFEALRENLEQDFQPETYLERELVQLLAIYTLRLRRIPVFEAAYIQFFEFAAREKLKRDRVFDPSLDHPALAIKELTMVRMALWLSRSEEFQNALAKLSRYEAFLLRAFKQTLQQLIVFRSGRPEPDKQLPPLVERSARDNSG